MNSSITLVNKDKYKFAELGLIKNSWINSSTNLVNNDKYKFGKFE